jgi:hypothetical protein
VIKVALQAAEKGLIWVKSGKKHASGAKARVLLVAFAARLKSCPFKTSTYSEVP